MEDPRSAALLALNLRGTPHHDAAFKVMLRVDELESELTGLRVMNDGLATWKDELQAKVEELEAKVPKDGDIVCKHDEHCPYGFVPERVG